MSSVALNLHRAFDQAWQPNPDEAPEDPEVDIKIICSD